MASFLDKLKIKTATDDRVKLDLGCDHISTAGWMQFTPVYNKEMVPKEKLSVNMETFTRMLPLVRPTFGRANINNRAFFVPYRTVMQGWNDFITDAPHVGFGENTGSISTVGLLNSVPTFSNLNFLTMIRSTRFSTEVSSPSIDNPYDYAIANVSGSTVHIKLNSAGRQVMKIMYSLGYNFIWDNNVDYTYSALPLLAVAKVYTDWYWPSAYQNSEIYNTILGYLRYDSSSSSLDLDDQDLAFIFRGINFTCYDSDYFTSAWDNPTGPNNDNFSSFTINNPNAGANKVNSSLVYTYGSTSSANAQPGSVMIGRSDASGNPNTTGATMNITQYLIDALKSLTDYMKRHQLVGAKAVDRYLARFGVNLSAEKMDRSIYLGSSKVPLQIGDIMNTADSNDAGLGDYAGKGIGYGQNTWEYDTDEYGQFIVISSIVPAIGYYQGVDRNVLHKTKLDFWTPEFDNLGVQAIGANELYIGTFGDGIQNQVFGWTPRYAEYKFAKDRLTGNYRLNTMNTGEECWYLYRNMDARYDGEEIADVVHSLDFVQSNDRSQFNRIFQGYVEDAIDQIDSFRMIYHFEIASYSPMKPMFETYEFDSNGKSVVEDVNGVKMN